MPSEEVISEGSLEKIGEEGSEITNHHKGLRMILEKIDGVEAVGHRVVHGAEEFTRPVLINEEVIRQVKECSSLAPLHNPANLEGILACLELLKGVRQIAVFDTAFHQSIPPKAFIYGLPYEFYEKHKIRKYGFHGTSHHFVAQEAAKRFKKKLSRVNLITCHLGNGCSMAAIKNGKSIDTSMGFTPLEGLIMGTRCGDIDPALITHIMHIENMTAGQVDRLLNKDSGLKGISGISNDMREIQAKARQGNKRAKLAVEIFVYRIRKYISAYMGALGKTDAIVFTAGIGQNQPALVKYICKGLFDNLRVKPKVMIIPTNEELMIARQTYGMVKKFRRVYR